MEEWERWTLGFAGMTIDDDREPEPGTKKIAFDTDRVPAWLIRPEAVDELFAVHRNIRDTLRGTDISGLTGQTFVKFACLENTCLATCKLISFAMSAVVCYGYYRTQGVPYPGTSLSHLYDPELTPELKELLVVVDDAITSPAFTGFERAFTLDQFYRVFVALAEITNGMLLDKVVTTLRSRGDGFCHRPADLADDRLSPLLASFAEVSRLFAEKEPAWEIKREQICREEVEAPLTWLIGAKKTVEDTADGLLHPPGKRGKSLTISVKEAALAFKVSIGTIKNWDKGKGRPAYYPGRDVDPCRFAACACEYLRLHNQSIVR